MIDEVKLINFPIINDYRGNLSYFENYKEIPFKIERSYWIYDVPSEEKRGGHAFKKSHEVIIALSGSFKAILNDGKNEKVFYLYRSYQGLYVPNLIWRQLESFSTNSLALIVSNIEYDPSDYIKSFNHFKNFKNEK